MPRLAILVRVLHCCLDFMQLVRCGGPLFVGASLCQGFGLLCRCCSGVVLGVHVFSPASQVSQGWSWRCRCFLKILEKLHEQQLERRDPSCLLEDLPATNSLRRRYLDEFFLWARDEGVDVNWMLDNHATCIDELNLLATRYGRLLYSNGKTYNQFAETFNGLTSLKPAIRRLMQGAWDLGYAWVRSEPSCHHVAIPVQILLSMISVALMWGWTACAGCLALGFGGLLRPGEFLGGVRRDLTLPEDVDYMVDFALFTIRDPKTRFTQARHQSSKIDCPDLLQVIRMVFRQHKPYQRLWPMSGQTFRVRFRQILVSLSLPTVARDGQKPLDPGSLRAGGASFLLLSTEDSELVRRRGRWANHKMMEIYVQEVTALTYTKQLNDAALQRVTQTARSFPAVLRQAVALLAANIPLKAWFWIFST